MVETLFVFWLVLAGHTVPADTAALQSFLAGPVESVGASIASITRTLGSAQKAEFELIPNQHVPMMKDVRITLDYPGCRFVVLAGLAADTSLMERVTITDPTAAAALELDWFDTPAAVRHRFGTPAEETGDQLLYRIENDVGIDTVAFTGTDGKITAVDWRYFID